MLVILILSLSVGSLQANDINDWFEGFNSRDTKLLWCEDHSDGRVFEVPFPPDCKFPDPRENSSAITISTYWPDKEEHHIVGKECYKSSYEKLATEKCLWLTTPLFHKANEKYEQISKDECLKMIKTLTSPTNEKLEYTSKGAWSTNNHRVPEPAHFSIARVTNVNFYVVNVGIAVDQESGQIEPIGTGIIGECHVDKEYCTTSKGLLIWDKQDHKTCRINVGKTTPCLKTGDQISCPDSITSIVGWTTAKICGVSVARASSGLLFSSNKSGEIHENVSSHLSIIEDIKKLHYEQHHIETLSDTGTLSTVQAMNLYQHLSSMVEENVNTALAQIHFQMCMMSKLQLTTHLYEASKGNVNGLLMGLTGDNELRGEFTGDHISVWKCKVVDQYHFGESDPNKCFQEHPVEYLLDSEKRSGWLRPYTKEIVDYPTKVDCPGLPFHFKMVNGSTIRLQDRKLVDVPQLPSSGTMQGPGKVSLGVFAPEAIFDPRKNGSRRKPAWHFLNIAIEVGRAIEQAKNNELPDATAEGFTFGIFDWILGLFMKPIIMIVVGIIGISVLLSMGGLTFVLNIIGIIFKCLTNVSKIAFFYAIKFLRLTFKVTYTKLIEIKEFFKTSEQLPVVETQSYNDPYHYAPPPYNPAYIK